MALNVETGAGLSNSESYISAAEATARHAAFGDTIWADLTVDEMEQALRRATAYMTQAYRTRWTGRRMYSTQALDWPRYGVMVDGYSVDSDIVPTEIANACADLALKAAAGELNPDLERAIIREKVGPLETEYSEFGPQGTRYRSVDMILAPFLKGSSAMVGLVRA